MNDLISRKALIAEYDRVHIGEAGNARKLIENAPAVDEPHWATETAYKNGYAKGYADSTERWSKLTNAEMKWIPVSEPPKENGYYLCVILFSAVGNKKEYRRKILFWEDNVWIEMANCFRTVKPLYWMPMAEMPQPPKGE
jgi:hypothetical protein